MKSLSVIVEKDHISKLTHFSSISAIAELIWNSLDAEATVVNVDINYSSIGIDSVTISDNGYGIHIDFVDNLFGRLGGSWKRSKLEGDNLHRLLHGREGQGRFRAFAIGDNVVWNSTYNSDFQNHKFSILGSLETINRFEVTDVEPTDVSQTGVEVVITNISKPNQLLDISVIREKLTAIFAIYLKSYNDTHIIVNGKKLNPNDAVIKVNRRKLQDIEFEGKLYSSNLEIVEWKGENSQIDTFFCTRGGLPLINADKDLISIKSDKHLSLYVSSELFEVLNSRALLVVPRLVPEVVVLTNEVQSKVKKLLKKKIEKEQTVEIKSLIDSNIYPYRGEPTKLWEKSERRIFDTFAHKIIKELPEIENSPLKVKKYHFNLLKNIIENAPETVLPIFSSLVSMDDIEEKNKISLMIKRYIHQKEKEQ